MSKSRPSSGRQPSGRSAGGRSGDLQETLDGPLKTLPAIRTRGTSLSEQNTRDASKASPSPSAWQARGTETPTALLDGHGLSQGLTSVLNAPNVAAGGGLSGWSWPFASGAELPMTVPPADPSVLPPVTLSQFQPYLRACSSAQSQFQATYEAGKAQAAAKERGRAFSPGDGLVEALKTVPHMLFDEHFSLARQETWEQVVATQDEQQRLARLEECSLYVDTVESQILKEIAALQAHSTQFFEASTLLQDLRASLQRAHMQAASTRLGLAYHHKEMQRAAAEAVKQKQQKANLEDVLNHLKVVEEVASAQQTLALLLPQGDFSAAMDVVDSLSSMVAQHKTLGLKAFDGLEDTLLATTQGIEELLLVEFLRATKIQKITPRLKQSIGKGSPAESMVYTVEELPPLSSEQRADLADDLTPIVECLVRIEGVGTAVSALQSSSISSIKEAIRDTVEQALMDLDNGRIPQKGVTDQLQSLGAEEFLALLSCVREVARGHMQHVKSVQFAVTALLKHNRSGRSALPEVDSEFQQVLQSVAEASHGRWIKLLAARSDIVSSLDLIALKALLQASEAFSSSMQDLGSTPVPALKSACQAQSRTYLDWMHRSGLVQLTTAMHKDCWAAVEAPPGSQQIVNRLCTRAGIQSFTNGNHPDQPQGMLDLKGHRFHMVSSFQDLLQAIDQYLDFQDAIPGLAAEVAHRIVELVKVYNSRMCQLVLGAGAMQAAGLKSITAKHLAISCHCVSTLMELHPILADILQPLVPTSRVRLLTSELNLLKKDLIIHRTEVHSKLVGIMRERLIASLTQLPALSQRWTAVPPQGVTPSAFAVSLAKQLRTLSQVLTRILAEDEVHLIFARIAAMFSKNLAEAFSRLDPLGLAWELQCRSDLNHLLAALQDLPLSADAQAASTERLSTLLKTRFVALEQAQPNGSNSHAGSSANRTLAARIGTARIPFFNSNGKGSEKDDARPDTGSAQDPPELPTLPRNSGKEQTLDVERPAPDGDVDAFLATANVEQPPPDHSPAIGQSDRPSSQLLRPEGEIELHSSKQSENYSEGGTEQSGQGANFQSADRVERSNKSESQNEDPSESMQRPPRETAESLLDKMEASVLDRNFKVHSRTQSMVEEGDSSPNEADDDKDSQDQQPSQPAELDQGPLPKAERSDSEANEGSVLPPAAERDQSILCTEPVIFNSSRPEEPHDGPTSKEEPVDEQAHRTGNPLPRQSEKMAVLENMLKSIQAEDWNDS